MPDRGRDRSSARLITSSGRGRTDCGIVRLVSPTSLRPAYHSAAKLGGSPICMVYESRAAAFRHRETPRRVVCRDAMHA